MKTRTLCLKEENFRLLVSEVQERQFVRSVSLSFVNQVFSKLEETGFIKLRGFSRMLKKQRYNLPSSLGPLLR